MREDAAAPGDTGGGWRNFATVFGALGPPLRPTPTDVEITRSAIAGSDSRVLLLGVTPELSVLGQQLIAIDNSPRMIELVWPGDTAYRNAALGDWTALPFEDASVTAVVGDGSLNSAPEQVREVMGEARRILSSGGCAVFRLFCAPDQPESLEAIREDVERGWSGNIHALKWRIAMALAALRTDAIVPVADILAAFDTLYPDRAALASLTGWSLEEIATLDAYVGATHSLGFPTLSAFLALGAGYFGEANVVHARGYPLAERCPTVIWSSRLP